MSVVLTLTGQISIVDASSTTSVPVVLSLPFTGTTADITKSAIIPAAPTAIALDVSPVQFLYIKNLSGTATLTVTWTPNGGASATVITLQPGGALIFVEPNTSAGITALSVQASAPATQIEYILGG